MRDVDAWAIDTQGVPSLDLMERAGEGLARITAAAARPGPIRIVVGKGNNGGDGLVVARLLREEGREVDVLAVADLGGLEGDAKANLDRLPGDPPRGVHRRGAGGLGRGGRRHAGHGLQRRAARADRLAPSPRSTTRTRRWWPATCPPGVDAEHRPRGGPGGPGHGDRDLPRPQGGPVRGARRAARGHGRGHRHRRAPRRADGGAGGPDRRRRAGPVPAPHPRRVEVRLRRGGHRRRGRGPDRRAHHGRAGGPARGRGLRAGGGARGGADHAGAAPAGGHDPRAARPRRRPHGGGGGDPGRDGRARRGGGAGPGPGPHRGRRGVRPRGRPGAWRRRC